MDDTNMWANKDKKEKRLNKMAIKLGTPNIKILTDTTKQIIIFIFWWITNKWLIIKVYIILSK